jgi:hypothetical protein
MKAIYEPKGMAREYAPLAPLQRLEAFPKYIGKGR